MPAGPPAAAIGRQRGVGTRLRQRLAAARARSAARDRACRASRRHLAQAVCWRSVGAPGPAPRAGGRAAMAERRAANSGRSTRTRSDRHVRKPAPRRGVGQFQRPVGTCPAAPAPAPPAPRLRPPRRSASAVAVGVGGMPPRKAEPRRNPVPSSEFAPAADGSQRASSARDRRVMFCIAKAVLQQHGHGGLRRARPSAGHWRCPP